jgi:hypothetical protein
MIGGILMANVKDVKSKAVKITLTDGVERTIKFTLNAMAELEDRYGSVDEAFKQLDNNSIKAVRCILWAGLIHEDPDLTEQQVGNLIDIQYMQELMASLGEAFDADMPEPEKLPETAEPKLDGAQDPNA